jgi:hypothetical protein
MSCTPYTPWRERDFADNCAAVGGKKGEIAKAGTTAQTGEAERSVD